MRKIAIIGATGMLGLPVALALLEAGFEVTALSRNAQAARRALPPAIHVVEADVRDEASLRRGLAGQDGLYLSLSVAASERRGGFHTEAQGIDNILSAARATGIRRVAYLSALVIDAERSDWWVLDVWRRAVARIKASGLAYTIFYPTNFMETIPQRHMIGRVLLMTGYSRYPNYWIAGSDYGRQVARAFARADAQSREYVIQGPEPITYGEAARRYARQLPRPAWVLTLPLFVVAIGGIVSRSLRFNAKIMGTVLSYREEFRAQAAWDELGRPTTTIEDFARRA